MSAGQTMDAKILMRKLVEKEINTSLLIEFYEEVAENEKVFCRMVEEISSPEEIEERERCVEHIEHFCVLLRELRMQHSAVLGKQKLFTTEIAKRENMIRNATRFLDLLEKDCNVRVSE